MGLTLYFAPGSTALAPLIALEEAGATFDAVRLKLADGDQRRPEYLALNPKGRVPTLLVDGQPLTEVIAILTYLDRRFPKAGLLPSADPEALGRAYEVMSWIASTVHVAFAQTTRPERYADEADVKAALAEPGRRRFIGTLATFEKLAAGPDDWLVGDRFTAVDAYALVVRRWADRIGVDASAYPAWKAKGDKAFGRASVVRALSRETDSSTAVAA